METARMTKPISRTTCSENRNDTDDLDDTLPIELLDCVDTTTNEDWLTRETPLPPKVKSAQTARINDLGPRTENLSFNPPLSSTRYNSDGPSEMSDVSMVTECGSAYDDESLSSASQKKSNFIPPLLAASMEFQPLRCSTAVTSNDLITTPQTHVNTFEIRVDTAELKPLREQSGVVQRDESVEFNPLRCSTGLTSGDAAQNPAEMRPTSPEEFHTACDNSDGNTRQENDTYFVTALDTTQGSNCRGNKSDRRRSSKSANSPENAKSPPVQVSESQRKTHKCADVDDDLSILMQCHLKIRNGRQIISDVQAKPQIEFSLSKNSPTGTAAAFPETKPKFLDGTTKIRSNVNQRDFQQDIKERRTSNNEVDAKFAAGEARLKLDGFKEMSAVMPSAIPTIAKIAGTSDLHKSKSSRGNSPSSAAGRQSPDDGNRVQRAIENLASSNMQKVICALAALDSARSALLCETLVQQRLVEKIYEFLSKMNRSLAHQAACIHATSLLLDLAKYPISSGSVWQRGERIGLLFNLMLIWASKDDAIFLNCATLVWIYCQNESRANILRHYVASQSKLLEKISVKLGLKIVRPTYKLPAMTPSWTNSGAQRTFENPSTAFSGLCALLKKAPPRVR